MKNYYEILEINENASQEIIEKVYKVLVKKYHPDLQENTETKAKYEEKIKEINEAYEVLSDEQKRKEYDAKLELEKQQKESFSNHNTTNSTKQASYSAPQTRYTNVSPKQNQNQSNPNFANQQSNDSEYYRQQLEREKQYQQDYQNAINKAYHDAYIQDMKNRGYKIKYKKTKKDYLRSLIALLITIGIIVIIANLPFVQNYFKDLYNNNVAFKQIIDFFGNMFK